MMICCHSLFYIIVNCIPLGLGLLAGQNKQYEDVILDCGNWNLESPDTDSGMCIHTSDMSVQFVAL